MAMHATSSSNSANPVQKLQQAPPPQQAKPKTPPVQIAQQPQQPKPVTNTQGHRTGTVVNTTA